MTVLDAVMEELRAALEGAPASSRGGLIKRAAETAGCSVQTVYDRLKRMGWTSGRKPRADKGRSVVDDAELRRLATAQAAGRNKRGQANVPTAEAHRIAQEAAAPAAQVSYGHLCRRLRQSGLSLKAMQAGAPAIARVSQHPNHVWVIDTSVCAQWYMRDEAGQRVELVTDAERRFYGNKPEQVKRQRAFLHRYLCVDHYSGALYCRYYYAAGESAVDMVDFLFHAMSAKPVHGFPMRGVPARILFDQGSANKSALVRELLAGLGVVVELHGVGNSKASGTVETAHNIWQRAFEGRLSQTPAVDLAELNQLAARFAARFNAERKLTRASATRTALWSTIDHKQLVEAPDRAIFNALAASTPAEGTLDNRLWLKVRGESWFVGGPNLFPGQKVRYRLTPLQAPGIRVWDCDRRELTATAITLDPRSGFPVEGAPLHRWDDETAKGASVRAAPAVDIAAAIKEGTAQVADPYRSPFANLDDESLEALAYRPVVGKAWTAPPEAAEAVAPVLLSSLEARERIADRMGEGFSDHADWWRERVADGVTELDLELLWAEFVAESTPTRSSALRLA